MSWYDRIVESSVRDQKKEQLSLIIEELGTVQEGCFIDKLSCEKSVDALITRMERKDERFLIPEELLLYLKESIAQAKSVLRDSPKRFSEIIQDVRISLDEHLYELQLKG